MSGQFQLGKTIEMIEVYIDKGRNPFLCQVNSNWHEKNEPRES